MNGVLGEGRVVAVFAHVDRAKCGAVSREGILRPGALHALYALDWETDEATFVGGGGVEAAVL